MKTQTNHLSWLGGFTPKDTVDRIMKNLFTNALASQYNWHGKSPKKGLGNLAIASAVKGTHEISISLRYGFHKNLTKYMRKEKTLINQSVNNT